MNTIWENIAKECEEESVDSNGQFFTVFNKEKFAELMVRACAQVVFDKTGPKSALNVLEHFGVKE